MKVTIYEADDGWRWRAQAGNNEIIATGEAYTRKADAKRAVNAMYDSADITVEQAADL